jgi:hypothetical protein
MAMDQQRAHIDPAAHALRRFLQKGVVGTITHASLIDRRSATEVHAAVDPEHVQLHVSGAAAFETLRFVLAMNPVSVVSRFTTAPWRPRQRGEITEALIEMEGRIQVQYYGSLSSHRDQYTFRVDGDRGAVRSSRWCISWRKRGWPVFVPIWFRVWPSAARSGRSDGDRDDRWPAALVDAAIRSDRTGQVVRVADVLAEHQPATSTPVAASHQS